MPSLASSLTSATLAAVVVEPEGNPHTPPSLIGVPWISSLSLAVCAGRANTA